MRPLNDLRQLARVAHKNDVSRGTAHSGHVCKSNLAGFVNEKPIKGLNIFVARKEPRGIAYDMGIG